MALIACTACGHPISSQARFCPKCRHSKANAVEIPATSTGTTPSVNEIPGTVASPDNRPVVSHTVSNTVSNEELMQLEFKPSLDEMIILEGRTFLVKGILNVADCYAYLTSKRYALCDASGVHIVFQIGNNGFTSVEEGRHLISKKIIIKTVSGETYQIKPQSHEKWLGALQNPPVAADLSDKSNEIRSTVSSNELEWFYESDGIKNGPVPEKSMIQCIRNNHTIYRHTKVWNAYLAEWKRAEDTILAFYFSAPAVSGVERSGGRKVAARFGLDISARIRRLFQRYV